MSLPLWSLFGFLLWTLVLLNVLAFVRWRHIVSGQYTLEDLQPAQTKSHPSDLHRRAIRAHMNCVENLPIYAGLVLIAHAINLQASFLGIAAMVFIVARIIQSLIHLSLPQTNSVIPWRSFFYLIQFVVYAVFIVAIIKTAL